MCPPGFTGTRCEQGKEEGSTRTWAGEDAWLGEDSQTMGMDLGG